MKNADENELLSIASEPANTHVYNVADFHIMSSIVEGLTRTVCEQVEQQDKEIKLSKQTKRCERETVKRSWMQNILDKHFNVLTTREITQKQQLSWVNQQLLIRLFIM